MKIIDMHCDTIAALYQKRMDGEEIPVLRNHLHVDLEKMKQGGYTLQNFALFTELKQAKQPLEYCMKLLDLFYTEMEKNQSLIGVVKTYQDIEDHMNLGKMSAMLTIEEGGVCRGELAHLRNFYRLGVRMMTLTWNYENELAYPNRQWTENGKTYFEPDTENGLKETGIAFVEEMERLGMIIDISHLSDAGIWDVVHHTRRPFVASHSNARAVTSCPRNLTDEMIRALSERGGVAGINFCAAFLHDWGEEDTQLSRVADMVEHIKHMKQVGGIECIGLGSDFDGINCGLEMDSPAKLSLLERAMEKEGFTQAEIEAVFYKNVLRVYREIL